MHLRKHAGDTIWLVAERRRTFEPPVGCFFKKLRDKHGWGQNQAARIAGGKGFLKLQKSLGRLERDEVMNPKPELLQEVAAFYGIPYESVRQRFMETRYAARDTLSSTENPANAAGEPVLSSPLPPAHAPSERATDPERQGVEHESGGGGLPSTLSEDSDRQRRATDFISTANVVVSGGDTAVAAYLISLTGALIDHAGAIRALAVQLSNRAKAAEDARGQTATHPTTGSDRSGRPRKHRG